MPAQKRVPVLPRLLLVLSGAAALVYQTIWIKQLSLVVGVDVHAIATAVSAFFAGLAVGGVVFGRLADTHARPFRLFAWLEAGSAILGVTATLVLAHSAAPFVAIEHRVGMLAWLLPFLLVGIPAMLMGGTLPAMMRAAGGDSGDVEARGGALYAANTAGAIAGVLLAPFVLIPSLGIMGTSIAAAAVNAVAAVVALFIVGRPIRLREGPARWGSGPLPTAEGRVGLPATPKPRESGSRTTQPRPQAPGHYLASDDDARVALRLYAVAGGLALGYEVVWSHVVVQFASTRVFAFSIVLATLLAGLVVGSAAYARRAARVRDRWHAFGLLIALAGLAAFACVALLGPWTMALQSWLEETVRAWSGNGLAAMSARFVVAAAGTVLVPAVLLGAAFPAALGLAVQAGHVGRDMGRVLAMNTAGGIVGTLVTGFLLIPALGTVRTLATLAVGAAAIGVVAVWRGSRQRTARTAVAGIAIAIGALTLLTPPDRIARLLMVNRGGGTLQFYSESAGGTVAVVEQQAGREPFRRLYIQGVSNSGDTMTSLRYMRLQALLPLLIHTGEPRAALVIGLGTGITAGALLQYPGLQTRVCAELLPAVAQAVPLFAGNFGVAADPRLDLRVRDGRRELLGSDTRYDLITLEPPPPSAAGVANLYSREFYALARARLQPGGLVAQWWPLPTQNDEDSRAIVRAFLDVFPHASVWTTELHEMLLVGSPDPTPLDMPTIRTRFEQPAVRAALAEVGIPSAEALVATWIGGREALERYAGDARPITDDRPHIEYATWVRPREITRVLPTLLALSTTPPLEGTDDESRRRVTIERERLHRFYRAALAAYGGDPEAARSGLMQVLSEEPVNPYYGWFVAQRAR